MRVLVLVGLLAVVHPALAQAQVPLEEPSSPARLTTAQASWTPARQLPIGQAPGTTPSVRPLHCCSAKGAAIGAGIGAVLGIMMVHSFCDSAHCGSDYFGAAAVLAGLGAGIGALAGGPSRTNPVAIPSGKRVAAAAIVSRQAKGGALAVRF